MFETCKSLSTIKKIILFLRKYNCNLITQNEKYPCSYEISFNSNTESLKQEYLDIFGGVKSDVIYTAQFDENNDIETAYLGISKMRRHDELKAEQRDL